MSKVDVQSLNMYFNLTLASTQLINGKPHGEVEG